MSSPTMREKVNGIMRKWGFAICILGPVLCICSSILLIIGIHEYNSASDGASDGRAKGATVDDFVSIGKRCFVEDIEYRHWTFVDDNSNQGRSTTTIYGCEEIWQYDFMVLDEEVDMDIDMVISFADAPYKE
eukprot:241786_1